MLSFEDTSAPPTQNPTFLYYNALELDIPDLPSPNPNPIPNPNHRQYDREQRVYLDAIWRRGAERLSGEGMHLTSHPDASSFTGGNTVKVVAELDHPTHGSKRAKLALDTQSDVTTCLREYLVDVHSIQPKRI